MCSAPAVYGGNVGRSYAKSAFLFEASLMAGMSLRVWLAVSRFRRRDLKMS